ncbi:inosine-uridine preferring nucleoside hydrolase domain-containing protein [Phthorimaea operculella]|nr:inosine-uridine preferring nucleoside hydrolase domain-containing protein [Phthorimaea operculella]
MENMRLYKYIAVITLLVLLISLVLVLLFVFVFKSDGAEKIPAGPKLVIDHDGGADDAMAIFLALVYEQHFNGPNVIGLTTTHGNVGEEQVFINSQRILNIANRRDVPIYRGSTSAIVHSPPSDYYFGKDGLGDLNNVVYETLLGPKDEPIHTQAEHAAVALIELSKKYEGELTVAVIGPVSNIALAVRLDPKFISRLKHLYIAAGNIYSEQYPQPEFNALLDVEGYHIVAEKSLVDNVTFIPFSPFHDLHNISMDWRLNVLGGIDTKIMKAQKLFERLTTFKPIWNHLDPQAMAMVLNNTLISNETCSNNSIILCDPGRGINTNHFTDCNDSNAKIAYAGPTEEFKTFLYDVFSAQL